MASTSPSVDFEGEASCPICMEYLSDPVTLDCGHNYCRSCITDYCEKWEQQRVGSLECPLCRARIKNRNFCLNWQLANIIEQIKLQALTEGGKDLCQRHKEKLHLFCKEDQELVCVLCERSPDHKLHTVVLKENIAQEYKDLISRCLETLREEKENILASKAEMENESQDLLELTETERQKTMALFRQLHLFLNEQENILVNRMEKVEKEIAAGRDQLMARLSERLSSLQRTIHEMEEKHQQPASELLQDVRGILERCKKRETFENPVTFRSELKRRISEFRDINPILASDTKQFKDILLLRQLQKANVILDPDTAYPCLILSKDCKSIRWGDKWQHLPKNPKRFIRFPSVLGHEGFTGGRHFWEVIVGTEGEWVVGIARKSLNRKDFINLSPGGGIWAVGKWAGEYKAFNQPHCPSLSLRWEPSTIRVFLNFDEREVSFFDADIGALISRASFSGETIHPFFWLLEKNTHLTIS